MTDCTGDYANACCATNGCSDDCDTCGWKDSTNDCTGDYTNTTVTDNKVTRFTIADDEPTLQPKMWQSALTDAAFYFDHPTVQQEDRMRRRIQHRYDHLFPEGWRAPLQTRKDLVAWVCEQHNSFMAAREAPEDRMWNCEQPLALIDEHGPNYASVQAKLGFVKGLFRE